MLERAPGIYEVVLHSNQKSIDEIKIFLIPGREGERSLMVDAGFRKRQCLETMEEAMGNVSGRRPRRPQKSPVCAPQSQKRPRLRVWWNG